MQTMPNLQQEQEETSPQAIPNQQRPNPFLSLNDLLHLINEGKKGFEKYKGSFDKILRDFTMQYEENEEKALTRRNKSRLFIPVTTAKVRRILCSFQEAYFSNEDIVKISQELEGNEQEEITEALKLAFSYYTKNKIGLFQPLTYSMLQAILLGTSIAKVFWNGKKPTIENISIYDIYLDPTARNNKELKYIVHKIHMSRMDIIHYAKQGIFNLEEIYFKEETEHKHSLYKKETLKEVYYFLAGSWKLATILENHILRQVELQDGQPFIIGQLLPQLHFQEEEAVLMYGDSPTAILSPLQREINIRRNQQIDAIKLALNPRTLIQEGSLIDPNAFTRGAGEIIPCADPSGIVFLPPPPMQEGIFDVNRLDLEAQEAIGVTNYNSGVANPNQLHNTATGVSVLSTEANTRIQSLIRSFNETFMQPLMGRIANLIYKYDEVFLNPMIQRPPLEFVATINTGIGATNPQTQIMNLDKAFAMFMQIGNQQGALKVLEDMLPLLGIKNKEDYFPTQQMQSQELPQELTPEQAMQLQQMQQGI